MDLPKAPLKFYHRNHKDGDDSSARHLSKKKRMQWGSFYTPPAIVQRCHELIESYRKSDTIILDNAAGLGAFLNHGDRMYRVVDCDPEACRILKEEFQSAHVFCQNALLNARRENYGIADRDALIMIGNPPYNDTTSAYQNGQKGSNECDDILFDRDKGISFLKSYDQLQADVVCVVHPLSYLIKETNFKRLRGFRDHYRLKHGELFSSGLFQGTRSVHFPIMLALYERDSRGMNYDFIRQFSFTLLESNKRWCLADYETSDGYIRKYPPRKDERQESPLGLYYYSFRDINSLKRNASFIREKHGSAIVVTLDNFYHYAYLYCFKHFFRVDDIWLYGNLSPLVKRSWLECNKDFCVSWTLAHHNIFRDMQSSIVEEISSFYNCSSFDVNHRSFIFW